MELGAQGGKEGWEVSEQLGCQEMKTSDVCVGVCVCFLQLPFGFIVFCILCKIIDFIIFLLHFSHLADVFVQIDLKWET